MPHDLEYCRDCCRRGAWEDAYDAFRLAGVRAPLETDDLWHFGIAAYFTGRQQEFERCFAQLHDARLERGDRPGAARSAFWIGLSLLQRGEAGQSNAWITRGQELIDGLDCVEHGYLGLPAAEHHLRDGSNDAAVEVASAAYAAGERFADEELMAVARHVQARALVQLDRTAEGLALLDQAMLPAVAGRLSPLVTGLLYCSVIATCRRIYALSRAREWTFALHRWCERQSDALAFSGACLVHRAAILTFHGSWPDALADAHRACECAARAERKPPAGAPYQQAEIHRLRGECAQAEEAYRAARQLGYDPQPGHALLRLAEGHAESAQATIRQVIGGTTDRARRAQLLPACVEIALACGDIEHARVAAAELEALAGTFDADALRAAAAYASGAVDLAEGRTPAALVALRRAFDLWTRLDAPYDAARARVLVGRACRVLGDEDTCAMEFDAARQAFEQLGARPDLVRLDHLARDARADHDHPLSPREREVLRRIAAGETNRAIAARLSLSERTVDRHVSNILTKLGVASRAAATAYAYEHKLL